MPTTEANSRSQQKRVLFLSAKATPQQKDKPTETQSTLDNPSLYSTNHGPQLVEYLMQPVHRPDAACLVPIWTLAILEIERSQSSTRRSLSSTIRR